MTKYPNREALRKAHDIYRDAMRQFIVRCLKRIRGEHVEDLIRDSLPGKKVEQFEIVLQKHNGNIEAAIDIDHFPDIVRKHWHRDRAFSQQFDPDSKIQYKTGSIVDGRNRWAHPGVEDLDSHRTQADLTYVAEVLGEIRNIEAKQAVEAIRDQLFSDEVEEHPAEVENAALKKNLADMTKQLDAAEAERSELEDRLKELEAEWIASEERLETVSTQLKIAVAEKTVAEERLSDISNRFEETEIENAELKKRLSETENRLRTVEEELAELKEPLPQNRNIPDFVIFQGTTFIKHLDKYRVVGDAITQSFWNYWHSHLGPEGKEEMRDAGWSVEKVDDDYWEITVSPEDFEAWVEEDDDDEPLGRSIQRSSALTESIRLSDERTSLPTIKEMVQPALKLFADRKEHRRVEMINRLTEHFSLDDEERRYISKTGQVEKHLMKEGLIERTRTGYYRITAYGLEVVNDVPF